MQDVCSFFFFIWTFYMFYELFSCLFFSFFSLVEVEVVEVGFGPRYTTHILWQAATFLAMHSPLHVRVIKSVGEATACVT